MFLGLSLIFSPLLVTSVTLAETPIHFNLVINATPSNYTALSINIPATYSTTVPVTEWASTPLLTFMPTQETQDNWHSMIAVAKYLGKKLEASTVINLMKSSLLPEITNPVIHEESKESVNGYEKALLTLSYDRKNGHEICKAIYYSGPLDCVGVQYTLRAALGTPDATLLPELTQFFTENVRLSSSP